MSSLAAVDEFVLLAETPSDGGSMRRTYLARHGKRTQSWGFDIDKNGRLLGFGPM